MINGKEKLEKAQIKLIVGVRVRTVVLMDGKWIAEFDKRYFKWNNGEIQSL